MAKLVLNTDGMEEDYLSNARLLGIMTQLNNYRFCWLINEQLNYDFRLSTEAEIQIRKKGRNYYFQVYQYCETDTTTEHNIYDNKFEGEYLLPEFKHFDFLWLIKADIIYEEEFIKLQQDIRNIDGVQLVTELAQEKIRNKEFLII
jgi:hypothetical protein